MLINNAGIERMDTVDELRMEDFRAVMETNYFGVIRCIVAVLLEMIQRRSGCIINVTSVAGRIAPPSMSAHSASKFALVSVSEILAQEVKLSGIRVVIVEPGIIDTLMSNHVTVLPVNSHHSHQKSIVALFTAPFKNPYRPPTIVANKILEIASNETWQFRHPVGPDALPFIGWRQSMTDEEWVDLGALDMTIGIIASNPTSVWNCPVRFCSEGPRINHQIVSRIFKESNTLIKIFNRHSSYFFPELTDKVFNILQNIKGSRGTFFCSEKQT